jgi:hypothetical protein
VAATAAIVGGLPSRTSIGRQATQFSASRMIILCSERSTGGRMMASRTFGNQAAPSSVRATARVLRVKSMTPS